MHNLATGTLALAVTLAFSFSSVATAQTYFYKRVAIVNNGKRTTTNDDAHYITFNSKGCYDSDKNGIADISTCFVRFIKNANNMHCYKGPTYYGKAEYFFNSDYSRLNVKTESGTYVYVKTNTSTSAKRRGQSSTRNNSASVSVAPINGYSPSVSSSSSPSSRRQCPSCHGTGMGRDEIVYGSSFTGLSDNVYCSKCGRTTSAHSHVQHKCQQCWGKGYVN